jgi:heme-degrading monooxygenase HmoA
MISPSETSPAIVCVAETVDKGTCIRVDVRDRTPVWRSSWRARIVAGGAESVFAREDLAGLEGRWAADRVIMSRCGMVLSAVVRHDRWMTIIKINAIRVPRESDDELAHRFAARAGAVDDADGFQGYELLKPTDDRDQWLVITRWRDEESFQAWLGSESFTQGHRSAAERQGGTTPKPVASHSEVWSYVVAGGSDFLLDRLPR